MTWARNLNTGQVTKAPGHYLTHPVFGKDFEPADKHDKDYLPELYKPPVPGEVKQTRRGRPEKKNEEPELVTETVTTVTASDSPES